VLPFMMDAKATRKAGFDGVDFRVSAAAEGDSFETWIVI
jgi:hypothetical protein